MKRYIGVGLGVLLFGCGGSQLFDATGHATGISPQGLAAAEYDLWGPLGNTGEVRVWSTGAYHGDVDGEPATIIDVVFDLQNVGQQTMLLSDLRLGANVEHIRLRNLTPVRVDGSSVVVPGDESRVHAYFAVSSKIDPNRLYGFRVSWKLEQGDRRFAQRTPFMQAPTYASYAPVLSTPAGRLQLVPVRDAGTPQPTSPRRV